MKQYLAMLVALLGLAGCAAQPGSSGDSDGAALTSVRWELTSWPGHEIPRGGEGSPPVILSFDDQGNQASVSGRAWCNPFNAPYVLRDGGRLTIGHAAATRMACPGKAMEFEATFLDWLQALERYKITGRTLELFAADGDVMTLQAREKPATPK